MGKLARKLREVRGKYPSYDQISRQDKAWVILYAVSELKRPKRVFAGLGSWYANRRNVRRK